MAEEFKNPFGSSTSIIEKLKKAQEEKARIEAEEKARKEAEELRRQEEIAKKEAEEKARKEAVAAEKKRQEEELKRKQQEAKRLKREEEERQKRIREENASARQTAIFLKHQTEHKKSQKQRIVWSVIIGVLFLCLIYSYFLYNQWLLSKYVCFPGTSGEVLKYCGFTIIAGLPTGALASGITYLMGHLVCKVILENHSEPYDSLALMEGDVSADYKIEKIMNNVKTFTLSNGITVFLAIFMGRFSVFISNYIIFAAVSIILLIASCYIMLWVNAEKIDSAIESFTFIFSMVLIVLVFLYYSVYLFAYFKNVPYVDHVWKFSSDIATLTFIFFVIFSIAINLLAGSCIEIHNILWFGCKLCGGMIAGIFVLSILPMMYLPLKWIVWVLTEIALLCAFAFLFADEKG